MGFRLDLAPLGKAFESWGQAKYGKKIGEFKQLQAQAAQAIQMIKTSSPDSPTYQQGMAMLQQVESQVMDDPQALAELQKMGADARIQATSQQVMAQRPDVNKPFPLNNPRNPNVFANTDLSLQGNYSGMGLFNDDGKQLGVGRQSFEANDLGQYKQQLEAFANDDRAFTQQVVTNAAQHLQSNDSLNYLEVNGQREQFEDLLRRASGGDMSALNDLREMDTALDKIRTESSGIMGKEFSTVGLMKEEKEFNIWDEKSKISTSRSLANSIKLANHKFGLKQNTKKESDWVNKLQELGKQRSILVPQIEDASKAAATSKNDLRDLPAYELYIDASSTEGIIGTNQLADLALIEDIAMKKFGKSFTQLSTAQLVDVKSEFKTQAQMIATAGGFEQDPLEPDYIDHVFKNIREKINNIGVDSYLDAQSTLMNLSSAEYQVETLGQAADRAQGKAVLLSLLSGVEPLDNNIYLQVDLDAPSVINPRVTNRELVLAEGKEYTQLLIKESKKELTREERMRMAEIERTAGNYLGASDISTMINLRNPIQPNNMETPGGTLGEEQRVVSQEAKQIADTLMGKVADQPPPLIVPNPPSPEELIDKATGLLGGPSVGDYTPEATRYLNNESPEVLMAISRGEVPRHLVEGLYNTLNAMGKVNLKDRNAVQGYIRNSLQRAARETLENQETTVPRDGLSPEELRYYK